MKKWLKEQKKLNKYAWEEYEKLPDWIKDELADAHIHTVLRCDHDEPTNKDSDEWDDWFDKYQQNVYREYEVVELIKKILEKNNKPIMPDRNGWKTVSSVNTLEIERDILKNYITQLVEELKNLGYEVDFTEDDKLKIVKK